MSKQQRSPILEAVPTGAAEGEVITRPKPESARRGKRTDFWQGTGCRLTATEPSASHRARAPVP